METYNTILLEKRWHGALITLNRPEVLNAMNEELCDELDAALERVRCDPEVRAVVITGSPDAFSVGEDLGPKDPRPLAWPCGLPEGSSLVYEYDRRRDASRERTLHSQIHRWEYPKPIIGAVSGWCFGAGAGLALTCHLTIAAENAVFGQPQVRHSAGSDFNWVLLAGFKKALRYSLTGDHLDAREALRLRLVNKVVRTETLLDECFAIVERIALVPPETVKINLQKATLGLEMMGLRKAWNLNAELAAMAELSTREQFGRPLDEARKEAGLKGFFAARDAPFQPEPFGPRSRGGSGLGARGSGSTRTP